MNITIIWGTYYSDNRGVNALTYGIVDLLNNKDKNVKITLIGTGSNFTQKIDEKTTFYPIMGFIGKKNILKPSKRKDFINKIKSADIVLDISEGDSFTDIYGVKRLILHSYTKYLAGKYNKRAYLLPQTIGPFNKKLSKVIAKGALKRVKKIFVRDYISLDYASSLSEVENEVFPDLSFAMLEKQPTKVPEAILNKYTDIIGINISGLLWDNGYTGKNEFGLKIDYKIFSKKLIKAFLDMNLNIILIPHTYNTDLTDVGENDLRASKEAYNDIISELKYKTAKIEILDYNVTAKEVKWIISKTDFFIGARMHACLAATSTNTPTAAISYSRKFAGLYSSIGLGQCVFDPKKALSEDQMVKDIIDFYFRKSEIKELIQHNTKFAKEKLSSLTEELWSN